MLERDILACDSSVLSAAQRRAYFEQGYVLCEGLLDELWLTRAREAYLRAIERSREVTASNRWFSLHADHTGERTKVLRVERLPDQDPAFWDFAVNSPAADLACDVLGPDVKYRDSMINVKPPGSAGQVGWHQDLTFYPHTNVGAIQVLIALYDVTEELGPLTVVPGSLKGEIFEHYDEQDNWIGEIPRSDLARIDFTGKIELTMAAGDAVALHPLTVHGSAPNRSSDNRPLLIHGFDAADSMSYTAMTWGNSHTGEIVRGKPARYAQHDNLRLRLPPDWSQGYTSIFEHQEAG